jgi:histidyl-tRNA synthetase
MMIDAPVESPLDVVIAVEDDAALVHATMTLANLRRAGLSAEMIATGSPRKRFDKAAKVDARSMVSFVVRDGKIHCGQRGDKDMVERVSKLLPSTAPEAK